MNTTETKTRTITLTGRQPVKIKDVDWGAIAEGRYENWDNEFEFQANRKTKAWIKVRQHADGRTVVYGRWTYSTAFQNERDADYAGGYVLQPPAGQTIDTSGTVWQEIPDTISQLAEELIERGAGEQMRDVAAECIADLPAEVL